MKTQHLCVLFLVVLVWSNIGALQAGSYRAVTHYQYAINWAPTYCKVVKNCVPNLPEQFFMHGIWAGNANGRTENNCQRKPPISNALLEKLQARLSKSWPSIIQDMEASSLWKHEYNEHGVCFEGWTPDNYLSFASTISERNNITKLLDTNGVKISPTVKYSRTAIEKAIRSKIGAGFNIYLGCERDGTVFHLRDAVICIKKKDRPEYFNVYEFVSCPRRIDAKYNNCGGGLGEQENIVLL